MASSCTYNDGIDHCPIPAEPETDRCREHTPRASGPPPTVDIKPGDYVNVEWDRMPGPGCVTLNGQPLSASRLSIEWPPPEDRRTRLGCRPVLTIEQTVYPPRRRGELDADVTARVVSRGYLVPIEEWEAFEAWRLAERHAARQRPASSIDGLVGFKS